MTARRTLKFIAAVLLAWAVGTLIHAWHLSDEEVLRYATIR